MRKLAIAYNQFFNKKSFILSEANDLFRDFILEKDFRGFCRAMIERDFIREIDQDAFRVNDNGLF